MLVSVESMDADSWPANCKPYTNVTQILTRENLVMDAGPLGTIHGAVEEFVNKCTSARLPVVHNVNGGNNLAKHKLMLKKLSFCLTLCRCVCRP